jgi:hypothetical protein
MGKVNLLEHQIKHEEKEIM